MQTLGRIEKPLYCITCTMLAVVSCAEGRYECITLTNFLAAPLVIIGTYAAGLTAILASFSACLSWCSYLGLESRFRRDQNKS